MDLSAIIAELKRSTDTFGPYIRQQAERIQDGLRLLQLPGPFDGEADLGPNSRQVQQDCGVLGQVGDASRTAPDAAGERREAARDKAQKGGLAAAVGSAQRDDFARASREIDTFQHRPAVEAGADVFQRPGFAAHGRDSCRPK